MSFFTKTMKLKYICQAVVMATILFYSSSAFATTYECKTKQAFEWKDGALKPRPFWTNTKPKNVIPYQPIIRFDDQTSSLQARESEDFPFGQISAQIDVPMGPNNDLVVSTKNTVKNPKGDEQFVGTTILKIRGWRLDKDLHFHPAPLHFFLYNESTDYIEIGGCVILN